MVFYNYSWQDCIYNEISTRECIVLYQGGPIDNCTHVACPVAQYSARIEYNSEFTVGMSLAHFRMIHNELLNKDTYVVP